MRAVDNPAGLVNVDGASHGSVRVMTKSPHTFFFVDVDFALVPVPQILTVIVPGVLVLDVYSV